MVWWWPFGGAPQQAVAPPRDRAAECRERKCRSRRSGLAGCRLANQDQPSTCKNLEIALVSCLSEGLCKQEFTEHKKCYTSLYKAGVYKGVGHCITYEDAMKACLKKQKLYPV